ncbi:MAG: TetR/AcrR family transcriptional regulator [Thermomicrobiales bacterium]
MSMSAQEQDLKTHPATGTQRERNPHGSGRRLREELMDAADRLLAAGATPESLSLRAVAREAGVAAPSVYLQYENKEALIDAVVSRRFQQLADLVTVSIADEPDPYARLHRGCLAYIAFAQEHPSAYRMIFEVKIPVLNPESPTGRDVFQILVDAVHACLPEGSGSPERAFRIATDIWVAMHGMVSLRRNLHGFPWPDAKEQLSGIISALLPHLPASS